MTITPWEIEFLTPAAALEVLRKPRGARGRKMICFNASTPAKRAINCGSRDECRDVQLSGFIELSKQQACAALVEFYVKRYSGGDSAPALVKFTWGDDILFIN